MAAPKKGAVLTVLVRGLVRDTVGERLEEDGAVRRLDPEERPAVFADAVIDLVYRYMGSDGPVATLWNLELLVDAWQLVEELSNTFLTLAPELQTSTPINRAGSDMAGREALCNVLHRHMRLFRRESEHGPLIGARATIPQIVATHAGYSWQAFLVDCELKLQTEGGYREGYFFGT